MVPEWKKFYDQSTVEKIGASLDSGDVPTVFENIGKVGEACAKAAACALGVGSTWKNLNVLDIAAGSGAWGIAFAESDGE